MTRIHDLFLGPFRPPRHHSADEGASVQEVVVHPPAAHALRAHLRCCGRWRGGLLFGTSASGVLSLEFASPGTAPGCGVALDSPLAMEAEYVMGWADAITATHGGELDWQGMWIMTPSGELGDALDQMRWVQQARTRGLLTEEMTLMCVGWREGRMAANAYIQRDDPESIPVRFQKEGSGAALFAATPSRSE